MRIEDVKELLAKVEKRIHAPDTPIDPFDRHLLKELKIICESLIARAYLIPEVVEALQRGIELCEKGHGAEWAEEARAALAKAEDKAEEGTVTK